jgi:hypothetical protein
VKVVVLEVTAAVKVMEVTVMMAVVGTIITTKNECLIISSSDRTKTKSHYPSPST